MSDRLWVRSRRWSQARAMSTLLVLAMLLTATVLPAQDTSAARSIDADAARARLDAAVASAERAEAEFNRLRAGGTDFEAAVTEGRLTVRFAPADLDEADRARLQEGLRRGQAELERRFGASGPALLGSPTWFLDGFARFGGTGFSLGTKPGSWQDGLRLRSPIAEDDVAGYVMRQASREFARSMPLIGTFTRGATLIAEDAEYEEAARELALGWSAAGRRCATGVVAGCRAIFTDATGLEALRLWFDDEDHQALVVQYKVQGVQRDSAWLAGRSQCLKGDRAACTRLAETEGGRYPFTANVRGTLVAHALEAGGAASLDRLRAASATGVGALGALAAAAGVSEDELLAGWQSRTARALHDAREGHLPLLVSTTFWCGLLLFGATRRKP